MPAYGGFWVVTDRSDYVNAGFVIGRDMTLAIDGMFTPDDVEDLKRAVEQAGGPPIRYLLVTHAHPDHILGLAGYHGDLIAERLTATVIPERLVQWGSEAAVPTPCIQFHDHLTLALDDATILDVRRMGGHAPELCVVWNRRERSLWASDLVFSDRPPFFPPHMDLQRWIGALSELESWGPETVIPGHGPPGGVALLSQQRRWLEDFLRRADQLLAEGQDAEAAAAVLIAELDLPERLHNPYRAAVAHRAKSGRF